MAIQIPSLDSEPPPPTHKSGPDFSLTQTLSAHTRAVTALRFSNDGTVLVSAGADGYLHFWDLTTGEHKRSLRAHPTGINDISISPDSLYLATASDDTTSLIHLFQPLPTSSASFRPIPLRVFSTHTAPVLAVAFSPKSNLLVTGSFDESAIIWDVKGGKVLRVLPAHADAVWTVGWDGEGGMVLTGSTDGLIRLWDANSGQCLKTLDNDTNSPVSFATCTPSPFFLLSATLSSTLRVYNFVTSKVLKTIRAPGLYISDTHPCPAAVFGREETTETSENGLHGIGKRRKRETWVITGSENGKVVICDLGSRRVLQVLEAEADHPSPIVAIAVHPDGRTIASGSLEPDRAIRIWRDASSLSP